MNSSGMVRGVKLVLSMTMLMLMPCLAYSWMNRAKWQSSTK